MNFFTRVAAVSPVLRLGDAHSNVQEMLRIVAFNELNNVEVIVFPELSVLGYTCGDLFYQDSLLDDGIKAVEFFLEHNAQSASIVILGMPIVFFGRLYNCAVVIQGDQVLGIVPKSYLPNSNEYYEKRWFSSGKDLKNRAIDLFGLYEIPFGVDLLFSSQSKDLVIGVEICEDLWTVIPPSSMQALAGANVLVNLSASNELVGKGKYRRDLVSGQSSRCIASYVYANAGMDESSTDIVFSGHSLIAENGSILAELDSFCSNERQIIADLDLGFISYERRHSSSFNSVDPRGDFRMVSFPKRFFLNETIISLRNFSKYPFVPNDPNLLTRSCDEVLNIQTYALIRRLNHLGRPKVVLGISGGLDSTLALLICIRAFEMLELPLENIRTISMPGFGTTNRTLNNASELAKNLKVDYSVINIVDAVRQHFGDINFNEEELGVVYENAQARERTQILMDVANKCGGIVLGTGDLSESALGWCTFNGDHISMYHINAGVPKTLVQSLIKHLVLISDRFSSVRDLLLDILDTPITPELLPVDQLGDQLQLTEKSVGPYKLHDFYLYYFIRRGYSEGKLLQIALRTFEDEYDHEEIMKWHRVFFVRFYGQQFKRSVMPDGPKVGSVALSPRGDWRMPSDISYFYKF